MQATGFNEFADGNFVLRNWLGLGNRGKISPIPNYCGNQKYYNGLVIGPAEQVISLYELMQCNKYVNQSDLMVRFE